MEVLASVLFTSAVCGEGRGGAVGKRASSWRTAEARYFRSLRPQPSGVAGPEHGPLEDVWSCDWRGGEDRCRHGSANVDGL